MEKSVFKTDVATEPQIVDQDKQTKMCHSCGRLLPLSEFSMHRQSKDGHMNECKSCRRRKSTKNDSPVNPLEKFTARELMHELSARGYEGELTYTEIKVHKMKINDM